MLCICDLCNALEPKQSRMCCISAWKARARREPQEGTRGPNLQQQTDTWFLQHKSATLNLRTTHYKVRDLNSYGSESTKLSCTHSFGGQETLRRLQSFCKESLRRTCPSFHIRMKLSLSVHGAVLTPCAWWRSRHLQVVSDVAKAKTATIELHTVIEENALRVEVIDFACSQDLNLHGVCVAKQSQLMACHTQSFNWIHDLTCLNFLVFGILLSRKEILHQLRTNCNR